MSKRIMIVDDDREYTHLFHQMIERVGYEIVEVSHGSEVFTRLMTESFDLVILDYGMKDTRGDQICHNIRSEEKLKDLPLIVVTGYRDVDETFFKAIGANEVIYKPVNRTDLIEKVEKYIGKQ